MAQQISIVGLTSDDKVPGFYGETKYGQGRVSIGSLPVVLLLLGTKLSGGTATADADILDVLSGDDAVAYFGAGAELTRMCQAALRIPGVNLKALAVAENGSAVAGSATITVGGTWSAAGEPGVRIDGKLYRFTVGASDSTTTAAASLAAAINADPDAAVSASPSAAVVTITTRSKGVRANQRRVAKDLSLAQSGLTIALSGGTATTGGVTPLSSGAGADDVTNALALMATDQYDYIVPAQADSTNIALVKAHVAAQAGPTVNFLEHYIVAGTGTLAASVSIAQTTLNDARAQVLWYLYGETVPAEVAAVWGAIRATTEGENPNPNYDDVQLPGVAPQSQKADIAQHATLKSALNTGVTPLKTRSDGSVVMCRAIVTRSLNGSAPDYRTLDVGDAKVPDRIRQEIAAVWAEQKAANPYVGPDTSADEPNAPAGVLTPALWSAVVIAEVLQVAEAANWITDVAGNPPIATYDASAKRIMTAVPVVVRPTNHQMGVSVRQQAA